MAVNDTTTLVYEQGNETLLPLTSDEELSDEMAQRVRRVMRDYQLTDENEWMLVPEFIMDRELPLFNTTSAWVMACVREWLEFKIANCNTVTMSKKFVIEDIMKDLDKSPLLERLLSGKRPLPVAPPKSYGTSWYELVDEGFGICIDTSFSTSYSGGTNRRIVRIDSEEWKIVDENEEEEWAIVQWKETDYVFRLSRMDKEDFDTYLHPRLRKLVTKSGYSWKLTRLEKEHGD